MKSKIAIAISCMCFSLIAQTPTGAPPTPYPAFNPPTTQNVANFAWYRGGNTPGGPAGANNIFGTLFNSPIYTRTDGVQRMVLMGSNPAGSISGAIGLGTITPQSYLHLNSFGTNNSNGRLFRTDGNNNILNQWQFFTGPSNNLSEKFKLFVNANSLNAGLQSTSAQMFFNTATTNGAAPGGIAERMRLSYGIGGNLTGGFNTPGVTKILLSHDGFGAGYLPPAVAMLNLGSSTPNPSAGSRPWMDIGTYYSMHTDNMYVGLKDGGAQNYTSSVINWGDDPANTNSNNRLLYLFTGFGGQGESSTTDGLEVARMWASANAGRMGIGGDFGNNPYAIGNDPSNTLEVNSPVATFVANVVGTSGLRFTDLRSNSLPQPNPGTGVLSVDASGDVILVPGNSGISSANNGLLLTPGGVAQLGGACGNLGEIIAASLQTSRTINIGNYDFWFAGGNNTTGGVGVGGVPTTLPFCGTGNTFEISANLNNTKYGNANASGLRLTRLTAGSPALPNGTYGANNAKVLTVDDEGDVVLVDALVNTTTANNGLSFNGANVQFGLNCVATPAEITAGQLSNNRQIVTNGFNVMINGTGSVGIGLANNSCAPGNKLEIDNATANTSGLRFTQLTSASPAGAAIGKVLTVDASGDVVLVNSAAGNFGSSCSLPFANSNIASDWRVGMSGNSVNFDGTGNVNIGDLQGCVAGSSSPARLWVRNSFGSPNPTTGFRVDNNGATGSYAAYFNNGDVFCTGTGIFNNGAFTTSDKNIKTDVNTIKNPMDIINKLRPVSYKYDNTYAPQLTFDNNTNYGFIAQEVGSVVPELVHSTQVYGRIDSSGNTIDSTVTLQALNYSAIIPFAVGAIQQVNTRQQQMQEQLDKAGLSDAQVKTNISTFNALAKVKTLNPVSYNFTNANVPQLTFQSNLDYGFVAQQLETVYPELVDTVHIPASYDSLGNVVNAAKTLKSVNYKGMTALLARSIQEQQLTIDSLKNSVSKQDSINQAMQQQLTNLSNLINSCCSNNSRISANTIQNQLDIELSDKDVIVLNQNVPNPFAEQTTITYNVPQSVGKAQLLFYNSAGQIIQTVDIKTRGKGKVNVFASDLSSGLYHYTLVADGKVVDSKKMVRE